jgi:hypothetical protein
MQDRANTTALDTIEDQPTTDQRHALLERVAASVHLKRAARLREFLLYVGKRSLQEGCAEIHEQEIGSEVFGRPPSYDTSQDNIVRVNATELRKRIELHFTTEGVDEPLILEIPRGSYKPIFRRRLVEVQPLSPVPEESLQAALPAPAEPVPLAPAPPPNRPLIFSAIAILALAIGCLMLLQQNRAMRKSLHAWEGNPALTAFWPTFLQSRQQTDIILADSSITLIEDITRKPVSLTDYLNHNYIREIQSSDLSPDRRADLDLIVSRNNGSVGDFRVAQRIYALDPTSSALHLEFARFYMANSFKRDNVILIGSKKSNPWIHLFDDRLNFTIEYNPDNFQSFVANRNPQSGEQAIYEAPIDPYAAVGYSVIAFLPNPSHTANAILLAGTDSDATNAAGEFLTSETQLEKFRNLLHVQTFPYFEVVLKTSRLSGTPFTAEIVAYRTYPGNNQN